jgi:hypothetical protein
MENWKRLYAPADGNGHRVFVWNDGGCSPNAGRVSLADQSGPYPNLTDDGVLWVKPDSPGLVLTRRGENGESYIAVVIEVIDRKGDIGHVNTTLGTAKAVASYVKGWRCQLAPSVKRAVDAMTTLNAISETSDFAPIAMAQWLAGPDECCK